MCINRRETKETHKINKGCWDEALSIRPWLCTIAGNLHSAGMRLFFLRQQDKHAQGAARRSRSQLPTEADEFRSFKREMKRRSGWKSVVATAPPRQQPLLGGRGLVRSRGRRKQERMATVWVCVLTSEASASLEPDSTSSWSPESCSSFLCRINRPSGGKRSC